MRIHVLSDLHNEFGLFAYPETASDVVVCAGDIDVGIDGISWILETIRDRPVIYVLGNHEFYGQSTPKLLRQIQAIAKGTNVHVLENDSVVIDGVTFLGCTLWTDFSLFGDPVAASFAAKHCITDYNRIRVSPFYRKLRPKDTAALHRESRGWLAEALNDTGGKTVVVTHHAPTRRSLNPKYAWDLASAAYATDMEKVVAESGAKLWIHGHTHRAVDLRLGGTRLVANQRGYTDELAPGFIPDLVIEV